MKILVTGGSGFLGINLVRFLLNNGMTDIRVLDVLEFNYPEADRIDFIKGDIRDKSVVATAVRGANMIIHCAAALPLYKKEEIYSTEVDGTGNLLEKAFEEKIDRFIHISTTAVYGIPRHHPLKEEDPLEGVGHYGCAKIAAERLCEGYRKKNMCVPIIRPKSFVGPERLGVFAFFYEWADEGKNFPIIGSGNNRYQLLDVEDLCELIFHCITKVRESVNGTFNIGAEEFTTFREDMQAVLDEAGQGKKIVSLPAWPAITVLRILEALRLSPIYKWIYETACHDSYVSNEKIASEIGFRPRYSNKEALVRNFRWYLKNAGSFRGSSGISHRVPWKQGVLRLAKIFF